MDNLIDEIDTMFENITSSPLWNFPPAKPPNCFCYQLSRLLDLNMRQIDRLKCNRSTYPWRPED